MDDHIDWQKVYKYMGLEDHYQHFQMKKAKKKYGKDILSMMR
jgi:hypothetical protein